MGIFGVLSLVTFILGVWVICIMVTTHLLDSMESKNAKVFGVVLVIHLILTSPILLINLISKKAKKISERNIAEREI